MGPQDEPWLDAHGLRMQIDEIISPIQELLKTDPHQQLSHGVLGTILRILSVIREHQGSRLILDVEIYESLWKSPKPVTAVEMSVLLGSVRASLRRLEQLEQQGTYGSTAEASSSWGSAVEHLDSPPDEPGDWPGEDPGIRRYRLGADSQHRRTVAKRP